MSATDLVTKLEVEAQIDVPTSRAAALPALIDAATAAIERYVANALVIRTFTEDYSGGAKPWIRGGAKRIALHHYPIVSVTSITDDNGDTIPAVDYTIIAPLGWLEHDAAWPVPEGRWTIVYEAGRWTDVTVVSADVKQAAIETLRSWLSGRSPDVASVTVGPVTERYRETAGGVSGNLPGNVEEMLAPYRKRMV